ncbi:MAG: glycerate kinase [Parabacteroides merdae]
MEPVQGRYGISGDGQTALIEMAAVSGLPLVPEDKRNPMLTTTYGTGELILDALEQGCRHFIAGIGGSAANDAGLGMLQALRVPRFLDKRGNLVGDRRQDHVAGSLHRYICRTSGFKGGPLHDCLRCTQSLQAGLTGRLTYSLLQKGADAKMVKRTGYRYAQALSRVILSTTGKDISDIPGAGAAGGMGGELSLRSWNAELKPGIRLMLDVLDFGKRITWSRPDLYR